MKKTILTTIVLILTLIGLLSCKSVKEPEKTANKFYKLLIDDNFDATSDLVSALIWGNFTKEDWTILLQSRKENWGKPESWKITSTNVEATKIGIITELRFEVISEGGKSYEIIEFIEESSKMKITNYLYTENSDYKISEEDETIDAIQEFPTEEKTIESFYATYNTGNFSTIDNLLTQQTVTKEDIEKLKIQLSEKFKLYGKIKDIEKTDAGEFGEDNDKRFAIIYKVTYENGTSFFETFDFFALTEIGRIQYYNWTETTEKQ